MVFQQFNLFPHLSVAREGYGRAGTGCGGSRREPGGGAAPRDGAALDASGSNSTPITCPGAALGRPAAARRDRALARDVAGGHALRRADAALDPEWSATCSPSWVARRGGQTMIVVTHRGALRPRGGGSDCVHGRRPRRRAGPAGGHPRATPGGADPAVPPAGGARVTHPPPARHRQDGPLGLFQQLAAPASRSTPATSSPSRR